MPPACTAIRRMGNMAGAGSVPVTPTEPAEDPDQIGDPDSQDPSEETPPAAQPQTELEKWAPNGAGGCTP